MIYTPPFNVFETPFMEWRRKVVNILKKGNALEKSGDDYPLRIYVMFEYDLVESGFFESIMYESARLIYGEYPPVQQSKLYLANRKQPKRIIPNSYTNKAQMFVMQQGEENTGAWMTESVNLLDDYRAAFGEDPPVTATIAIMADSDNTGESATALIDYILIRSTEKDTEIHK